MNCISTHVPVSRVRKGNLTADPEPPLRPTRPLVAREDPPGLAVLDTACGVAANGEKWAQRLKEELKRLGIHWRADPCIHKFKGIGGRVESRERVF